MTVSLRGPNAFNFSAVLFFSIFVFVSHCIVLGGSHDIVFPWLRVVPDGFPCSAFWPPPIGFDAFP